MKKIVGALALALVAACGKEAGRVGYAAEGAHEATMTLKAGDVDFWTDIDAEWEGDARLAYEVQLVQGGTTVATTTCNPLGPLKVKTSWVETNVGSSHTRRGNGKMSCSVTLAKGGPTTVKSTLAFGQKPPKVTLRKADLVVKQ